MSGVSRFISFVIGLIVLILLFVLIANRFIANRQSANAAATPTPTPSPVVEQQQEEEGNFFTRLFGGNRAASPTPTILLTQAPGQVTGMISPTVAPSIVPSPTPTPEEGFNFFGLFRRNTPTPSPQPTLTFDQQMADAQQGVQPTGQTLQDGTITQIPNTGAPTLLIPFALAGMGAGFWLKKRK